VPIHIDEGFLWDVVKANETVYNQAPVASNGTIEDMVLHAGHQNFASGQRLAQAIRQNGAGVKARLTEIGTTAGNRAQQLRSFIGMTDNVEDLNDMTAQEFMSSIDTWNPNGSGK